MSNLKKYIFWLGVIAVIVFSVMQIFSLVLTGSTNTTGNPITAQTPVTVPIVPSTTSTTPTTVTTSQLTITPMQSTGQVFSQSSGRYYLIFPTLESGASQAIDGFTMTTDNLGNNIYRITLTPKVSDYKTETFVITGEDKIYFLENSFGDDNPSQDYVYGDDYAVAVDSQGYILQ